MGIVWRAHDQVLDRKVAVKEVLLDAAIDDYEVANSRQRTKREAQTAARLSHPNIVTVHDVTEEDGRPWIVMELIPSRSLDGVLTSQGPLTALRAGRIGEQLLAALTAAHAAGVLHRDVKPSNVLIAPGRSGDDQDERAVLTDFGIAQFEGDPRLTQTGQLIGTVSFMAPERFDGSDATPASDLWSLGATIYAAVEGRGPFDRITTLATMSAIVHEGPPPAPSAGRLAPLIAGLLRRDPAERLSALAAARMCTEILPLMAAEAMTPWREDTEPSVLPAPVAPPQPVSAPTRTSPPLPPQARAQFPWESGGGSRRPARRVRGRSSARRVRAIAPAALVIVLLAAISTAIFLLKQHPSSPGKNLSASAPASASASPTAAASRVSLPPVSSAAAVVQAIDQISDGLPPQYKTQVMPPSATGTVAGFSLDIPQDWLMNAMGQQTYQYTPKGPDDGVTYVDVNLTMDKKSNMVAEAALLAGQHRATYPDGYQRVYSATGQPKKNFVQLEPIRGTAGALWEFDYVSDGVTMRMDVLLFTLDQQSYTIYMTAQAGKDDNDWNADTLPIVKNILHTFEPLGA
jgi:serine/threonine protein kinase